MKQIFCLKKEDIATFQVGKNFEIEPPGKDLGFNFTDEALQELIQDYREARGYSLEVMQSDFKAVLEFVNRKLIPKPLLRKLEEWETFLERPDRRELVILSLK